jgi:hypothetical protein
VGVEGGEVCGEHRGGPLAAIRAVTNECIHQTG